jgi:co-chaperonin GroES (HSP10)
MKFRPLRHRVGVRRIEEQSKPAGSFSFLSCGTAQKKPVHREIFSVGPGICDATIMTAATAMKSGDRVLLGKWSGKTESDILGVIKSGASVRAVV